MEIEYTYLTTCGRGMSDNGLELRDQSVMRNSPEWKVQWLDGERRLCDVKSSVLTHVPATNIRQTVNATQKKTGVGIDRVSPHAGVLMVCVNNLYPMVTTSPTRQKPRHAFLFTKYLTFKENTRHSLQDL